MIWIHKIARDATCDAGYVFPRRLNWVPIDIHPVSGCSLWLLPPNDSPIKSKLSDLITTKIPTCFPELYNVNFEPHLTLTSDVMLPPNVSGNNEAQRWLDDLPLPHDVDLDICFESLVVGSHYFKKLTLSVDKGPLETFGAHVRSIAVENGNMAAATSWAKVWEPHVSLMYANIEFTIEKCQEILQVVIEEGIPFKKRTRIHQGWGRQLQWLEGGPDCTSRHLERAGELECHRFKSDMNCIYDISGLHNRLLHQGYVYRS